MILQVLPPPEARIFDPHYFLELMIFCHFLSTSTKSNANPWNIPLIYAPNGTGIFAYIYHRIYTSVGQYAIHLGSIWVGRCSPQPSHSRIFWSFQAPTPFAAACEARWDGRMMLVQCIDDKQLIRWSLVYQMHTKRILWSISWLRTCWSIKQLIDKYVSCVVLVYIQDFWHWEGFVG